MSNVDFWEALTDPKFVHVGTWEDPLKYNDPNDMFFGFPIMSKERTNELERARGILKVSDPPPTNGS